MNSIVIYGIFSKLLFVKTDNFEKFPENSKLENENSLSIDYNSISAFDFAEREFSFSNLEF